LSPEGKIILTLQDIDNRGVVKMTSITIQLERELAEKLKALGKKGETYSDVIRRLIDTVRYEEFMREQYRILDDEDEWVPLDAS
jgi:predicted CopG family antitoxin